MDTQSRHRCRVARTDNGAEYVNALQKMFFIARGIIHQTAVAYIPQNTTALPSA